jgi:hypothetical protein
MSTTESVTVRVLKYDGTEYRRWRGRLARKETSLVVLDAQFDVEVSHHLLGEIQRGTKTIEYYWLDRWYNVFQFLNDDEKTRLYYCNINMPPTFDQNLLTYIDLDIDILVQPDFSYQVLDLAEFERNAKHYGYSKDVRMRAHAALDEAVSIIETHQFPFAEFSVSSLANYS